MSAAYWRHRAEIAELLDPRLYNIEWLDEGVITGAVRTFGNDTAVIVTETKQYPAGAKEAHGLVAAGELTSILKLIEEAEAWGRDQGCDFASISSREGWVRVLAIKGYEPHQLTIRKELR